MLTKLKQQVQELLSTEAKIAHRMGLTPNSVSVIGFALSVLAGVAYAFTAPQQYALTTPQQPLWLVLGVFLLMASGFCDTLDGVLARTFNQATPFGGFLDSILDRYADLLVLAGVTFSGASVSGTAFSPAFSLIVGFVAIASSFMVSYSRARAEAAGIKMESIGIAERPERILILAASSLVAVFWLPAITIGVVVIAVFATVTVLQRGYHVYKVLNQREADKKT